MGSPRQDISVLMAQRNNHIESIETLEIGIAECEDQVKFILHTILPEVENHYDLDLGCWECEESPTEECVYNSDVDPEHDQCVFCGRPSERK